MSYHGTKKCSAESILDGGYLLSKGQRFAYGHGIYSSPDPKIGESYATEFTHDGINYKVMLQNRVNMADNRVCHSPHLLYIWVAGIPSGYL